ncbi:hypothetical protein P4I92_19105 [Bacillus cereus]|uniref:Uncharacterized protein n=1 Tax=Bacillus thuringiensis TaxID=1428 RepID=A0AAW9JLJ4_BACTU|nr:hypothetical protein [Bacillus thuringiensis]MDZ5479163.1 hypothetical protein [Bacillus thuringiensis]
MSRKVYAVYKGELLIGIGTLKESAQHFWVLPKTVHYYKSPAYKKRVATIKNARNYLTVIALEED